MLGIRAAGYLSQAGFYLSQIAMTDLIEIVLDGPPRGKGRPRFSTKGGSATTYTDAATRAYELKLAWEAKVAMRGKPPFEGPVHLAVIAYLPIPKYLSKADKLAAEKGDIVPVSKPDVDNILKVTDAFNGIVWNDDKQVVLASICKFYSPKPRLRISVGRYIARGMGDGVVPEGTGDSTCGGQSGSFEDD